MKNYKTIYEQQIMDLPNNEISCEEIIKLIGETNSGSKKARNKLVLEAMPIILKVLDTYKNDRDYNDLIAACDIEPLISDASLVLINEIGDFDVQGNISFNDYAESKITAYMENILNERRKTLNKEVNNYGEVIVEDSTKSIENKIIIEEALKNGLKKRDAEIYCYAKGICGYPALDTKTISYKYNISRQRVHQILDMALDRVKGELSTPKKRIYKVQEIVANYQNSEDSLTVEPLANYIKNSTAEERMQAINILSTKNKYYYNILMNVYKNGFDNVGTSANFDERYLIQYKVIEELRYLIKSKHNREANLVYSEYQKKEVDFTEPFEFTAEDIANSELFPMLINECSDLNKKIIYSKFFLKQNSEEIAARLSIDISIVNDVIINFIKCYRIKVNECFQDNNEIIYGKDFINEKLLKRTLSKMSSLNEYEVKAIKMRFDGYTTEDIALYFDTLKEGIDNLINNFQEFYLDKINFYIDNYIYLQLENGNKALKR